MKVIYSNNNICICGNCGCTLQYEMSDIRTKSECFNKGYTNDQYYDINYIHCPYCGRDNEVGWNIRTERSPFMRRRYDEKGEVKGTINKADNEANYLVTLLITKM